MSRKYKSGTGWCFWRWTHTPSGYITRLHVIKTPWFAIMLHWINGPDPEEDMHDHPVNFLSIILRGGYTEEKKLIEKYSRTSLNPVKTINHTWFNYISAWQSIHRIIKVKPNTLTLCFVGPKVREWVFHTKDGLIDWREYNKKYK